MTSIFVGFNEELRKRIRLDMNNIADHIATGACKDWAEYRKQVGVVEGLAMAERHLLDLIAAAEDKE